MKTVIFYLVAEGVRYPVHLWSSRHADYTTDLAFVLHSLLKRAKNV